MKPKLYQSKNSTDFTFVSHDGRLYSFYYQNGKVGGVSFKGKVGDNYPGTGTLLRSVPIFLKRTVFDLNRRAV